MMFNPACHTNVVSQSQSSIHLWVTQLLWCRRVIQELQKTSQHAVLRMVNSGWRRQPRNPPKGQLRGGATSELCRRTPAARVPHSTDWEPQTQDSDPTNKRDDMAPTQCVLIDDVLWMTMKKINSFFRWCAAGADDAHYEDSENESVRLVFVWMLVSSAMVFQFYSRLSNQKKHESTTQTDCSSARQLFLECTQKGFRNVTWTRPVLPNFDDDAFKGQFPINWPKRQPQRNGDPSWSGCRCHCDSQRLTKSTSPTSAKTRKKPQNDGGKIRSAGQQQHSPPDETTTASHEGLPAFQCVKTLSHATLWCFDLNEQQSGHHVLEASFRERVASGNIPFTLSRAGSALPNNLASC